MKRFLWFTPILFVLMSSSLFADSVSTIIFFQPNDGSGDNFGALQKGNGLVIGVGGGVAYDFFNIGPYAPGSEFGGTTDFFISGGFAQFGGNTYELSPLALGTVSLSGFTLPTNGKSVFTVPVEVDFTALMTILDTGQTFDLSGGARGKMSFSLFDGLYYPNGGFVNATVPEPGTLGLMATGLAGIIGVIRRKRTQVSRRLS